MALMVFAGFGLSMEGSSGTWTASPPHPSLQAKGSVSKRKGLHTIEKAEGWHAAPGGPGGARPWNQHAKLGPVATSEASRSQEGLLVKGFTGHFWRRRGALRAVWLGQRFPSLSLPKAL